jgi:hypothetical protein
MNQKDAKANVLLAKQSKKDGSAMKTIAIVTMGFLPGTFFATVFAIPSLQWTSDQVVTEKFWVYLAFTVPATLGVFAIWFMITGRGGVAGRDS